MTPHGGTAILAALLMLSCVRPSYAQAARQVSDVELLLDVFNMLHAADMVTTSYALTQSNDTREMNPVLKPFAARPTALVVASTALSATEVWAIAKLRAKHPRLAIGLAAVLVATEVWAVTNNIRVASQIQDRRSGWRPPFRP